MLCELKIENVAVIEKAAVHFGSGLNVLSGETGAGKSILIDSINAILGNRTSRELVRTHTPKARIWATFRQIPEKVQHQIEQAGYEIEDELLLYREISADGKSVCRVNGMPATCTFSVFWFDRHSRTARQPKPDGPIDALRRFGCICSKSETT